MDCSGTNQTISKSRNLRRTNLNLAIITCIAYALAIGTINPLAILFGAIFVLPPVGVTCFLAYYWRFNISQAVLLVCNLGYAGWLCYAFISAFVMHVDAQCGLIVLYVGYWSLPFLLPCWVVSFIVEVIHRNKQNGSKPHTDTPSRSPKEHTMTLREFAQKVVDMCNDRKNFDVMEQLYDPNIVSVEPTGKETVGQQAVIDKSKKWAEGVEIHSETVTGPFLNGDDQFATHTVWELTRKETGKKETLEEVSIYTVKNNLITREQFFFGGEQW